MVNENLRKRAARLVERAEKKGLVKTYDEFCDTKKAKDYAISKEDVIYYTSKYGRKQ